ncbi:MAG: hypothetical protein HQ541_13675, partial [Mariniphaga sp.]|nr:hypothetical protein [Mariniphaga sp.]
NPTISALEDLILKKDNSEKNIIGHDEDTNKSIIKNFAPVKPEGSREPFIMVHGDNCNNFMPKLLDKEQPYLGFLHIGSEGEKLGYENIQNLATFYIEQLLEYKPKGPYLLGGHSFGGIIAYEMAHQLTGMGYDVPLLVISDSIIPEKIPVFALKRGIKRRIKIATKRMKCNAYLMSDKPVPVEYRNFYILDSYERLSFNYKPPVYKNKILFIRASKNPGEISYKPWYHAAKNMKMVELEGTHNEIIINKELITQYVDIIQNELIEVQVGL